MDNQDYVFMLALCFLIYSFLGWAVEVAAFALKDRHFKNRGVLSLPLAMPSGFTMVVIIAAMPTVERDLAVQFLLTWLVTSIIWGMSEQFGRSVLRRKSPDGKKDGISVKRQFIPSLILAAGYLIVYLVIHPFVFALIRVMPQWLVKTIVFVMSAAVILDYLFVRHVLRTKLIVRVGDEQKERTQRLAAGISASIWKRLKKAYPGIEEEAAVGPSRYVFAKGICFDKLVWVFLISSFLGALIEMVYCRFTIGYWMSRSSVLYGSFSFVWGFGAVVLTVALQRLADKEDRKVFLAGFVVGGTYEYLASVFTEIVFGKIFWDYSHIPLNIGGRTNLFFCLFWGALAVLWIKVLYPPMDRGIEKIAPLAGKILTWIIVVVMACNGVLTSAAMIRHSARQTQPEPSNFVEEYLDEQYDDEWMENRWPKMKAPKK